MRIPIETGVRCIRQLHFLDQNAPRHRGKGTILYRATWEVAQADDAEVTRLTVICHPISTRRYQKRPLHNRLRPFNNKL